MLAVFATNVGKVNQFKPVNKPGFKCSLESLGRDLPQWYTYYDLYMYFSYLNIDSELNCISL